VHRRVQVVRHRSARGSSGWSTRSKLPALASPAVSSFFSPFIRPRPPGLPPLPAAAAAVARPCYPPTGGYPPVLFCPTLVFIVVFLLRVRRSAENWLHSSRPLPVASSFSFTASQPARVSRARNRATASGFPRDLDKELRNRCIFRVTPR